MNKKLLPGMFLPLLIAILVIPIAYADGIPPCMDLCFRKRIVCGYLTTIPMKTDYQWKLEIIVWSSTGMQDAVVTDRFNAEIEIDEPFPFSITHGEANYYTKGKSDKVFLTWDIGDLDPDETAILTLLISTDINSAGQQEYTTPGCYELNSGAVLKFKFDGNKYSAWTGPLMIYVEG